MTPARTVLSWIGPADRRDAVIAGAVMAILGLWREGPAEAPLYGILGAVSLLILRIDSRRHLIPDLLVLCVAVAGVIRLIMAGASLWPVLAASAVTFAAMAGLRRLAGWWTGAAAFGGGDVKLITAAALWLGPAQVPSYLLAAALTGIADAALTRPRARRIAFGRHLAPWLCLFALLGTDFRL